MGADPKILHVMSKNNYCIRSIFKVKQNTTTNLNYLGNHKFEVNKKQYIGKSL